MTSRFFFALLVMRRRELYSTKVGSSPQRLGGRRSPGAEKPSSASAMFCMEVSSLPRTPSFVTGLERFTSIPGNAPRGERSSAFWIFSSPMYSTFVFAGNRASDDPGATGSSEMPCLCSTVYSTLLTPCR